MATCYFTWNRCSLFVCIRIFRSVVNLWHGAMTMTTTIMSLNDKSDVRLCLRAKIVLVSHRNGWLHLKTLGETASNAISASLSLNSIRGYSQFDHIHFRKSKHWKIDLWAECSILACTLTYDAIHNIFKLISFLVEGFGSFLKNIPYHFCFSQTRRNVLIPMVHACIGYVRRMRQTNKTKLAINKLIDLYPQYVERFGGIIFENDKYMIVTKLCVIFHYLCHSFNLFSLRISYDRSLLFAVCASLDFSLTVK